MALTTGGGTFTGPLIYLNARSKDANNQPIKPRFEIAKKDEAGKITATGETCDRVSGDMLRPRFVTRKGKDGKPDTQHVVLSIEDKDERCQIDCSFRIATRNLFNALLSLTDPKGISISIYANKKGYECLSLWQGDTMVPWKFDSRKGEIPEAEEIKDKKGAVVKTDFSEVDAFYLENLKAWAEEVFGPERKSAQQNSGGEAPANEAPTKTAAPQAQKSAPATTTKVAPKATNTPAKTVAQKQTPPPAEDLDDSIPF